MASAIIDWFIEYIFPWLTIIFVGALVIFIFVLFPMAIYQEVTAETFELKKADWVCMAQHKETTTTYVYSGNGKSGVMVPITSTHDECDNWSRKVEMVKP